ncbi:MAG: hypothetical protein V3V74_02425 [Nitrosomonadaceae bacterium]
MSAKKRPNAETLGISTTGGYNSAEINIEGNTEEIHLVVSNMANGDGNATLQVNVSGTNVDGDDDWENYFIDGVQQVITQTTGSENNGLVLRAPGVFRIVKPETVSAGQVIAYRHHKILVS